jgi:hypothetical protein
MKELDRGSRPPTERSRRSPGFSRNSGVREACAGAIVVVLGTVGLTAIQLPWPGSAADAAPACTITFTNTSGGSFFTPANWTDNSSAHRLPITTDDACIPSGVTGAVTFSVSGGNMTVDRLTAAGSGGFTMTLGTLTLTDSTNSSAIYDGILSGGIITGAGALSLTGTTTWNNAAMEGTGTTTVANGATLATAATAFPDLERPLVNDGTVSVAGGHGGLYFNNGTLTNNADGVVNLDGDAANLNDQAGSNSIINSGTLEHSSGTGTTTISVPLTTSLNNLLVQAGTLSLTDGGTLLSGTGTIPSGTTLSFGGGSFTVNGATFSGPGTTQVTGNGTWQLAASTTTTVNTPFTFGGGTITGAGALSLTGTGTWNGPGNTAAMEGTGTTTVAHGAVLATAATAFPDLERPLVNDGTVSVAGGHGGLYFYNGTLTNNADGVVNLEGDASNLYDQAGSNSIINSGTLEHSSGTGTTTISVPLTNTSTGEIEVETGTLAIPTSFTSSGTINVGVNSATSFGSIAVTGTDNLAGSRLAISTNASYTPANGQAFTVFTCSIACTGQFASVTGTALPGGAKYVVGYSGTAVTLTVSPGVTITTSSLPSATIGQRYSATLAASGGNPPYTWKVVKGMGSLPKGLKLNKKTGVISGTPSTTAVSSTFTVEVLDTKTKTKPKTQDTETKTFTITVS